MKRPFVALVCRLSLAAFVFSCGVGMASDRRDYSGSYKKQQQKKKGPDSQNVALHVIQSEQAIEVTRTENGIRTTNSFPLDGSEGPYTSPSGKPGKGKAQLKSKELILEYVVVTRAQPDAPIVRVGRRERWRLSPDGKLLSIRYEVKFPGADPMIRGAIEDAYISPTEKFLRVETP